MVDVLSLKCAKQVYLVMPKGEYSPTEWAWNASICQSFSKKKKKKKVIFFVLKYFKYLTIIGKKPNKKTPGMCA